MIGFSGKTTIPAALIGAAMFLDCSVFVATGCNVAVIGTTNEPARPMVPSRKAAILEGELDRVADDAQVGDVRRTRSLNSFATTIPSQEALQIANRLRLELAAMQAAPRRVPPPGLPRVEAQAANAWSTTHVAVAPQLGAGRPAGASNRSAVRH